jgi:hypothetical protein
VTIPELEDCSSWRSCDSIYGSAALPKEAASQAWRSDVVLECWISTDCNPSVVQFDGTLTAETAVQLLQIVNEVLALRPAELEIRTHALRISGGEARSILAGLPERVRAAGGVCRWDGITRYDSVSIRGNSFQN